MVRNILLVLASVGVLLQTPPPQYHPNYVWDRTGGQGKVWLSWSPERRQGFVEGYGSGYDSGYGQACLVYFTVSPARPMHLGEDTSLQKCKERELGYSKGVDYYAGQITAYYEKYPTNVDLPIVWLFQAFSDSENKSLEEIHQAWTRHEHP